MRGRSSGVANGGRVARVGRAATSPGAYGMGMSARVGGRNPVISWVVGLLCVGVIAALLWLSLPAGPGVVTVLMHMLGAPVPPGAAGQ